MSHPEPMRASLHRALRPGGRLVVIEKLEHGHGIAIEQLIEELTADGFELLDRHPRWQHNDDHYGVVFVRGSR